MNGLSGFAYIYSQGFTENGSNRNRFFISIVVEHLTGVCNVKRLVKTTICYFFSVYLLMSSVLWVQAAPDVSAPSYLLMETSTGQIICEQEADVRRSPASITKIMTLLLIFDHLDTGRIKLEDEIITSAHAKSMGGSQVFLEEGEVQTLDTMIKCIAVASGNDACVAVAKIWMEDITHVTRQGTTTFTLSSTNKLLRQYEWTTGLKTGSTSKAKYCLSATASKDGIDLIAVVMAAPDNKVRFQDAMALLNFGYSVSNIYIDENKEALPAQKVKGGVEDMVNLSFAGEFRYLDTKGSNLSQIEKTITLPAEVEAPIEEGQAIGEAVYKLDGQRIGGVSIVAAKSIEKAGYKDYVFKVLRKFLLW